MALNTNMTNALSGHIHAIGLTDEVSGWLKNSSGIVPRMLTIEQLAQRSRSDVVKHLIVWEDVVNLHEGILKQALLDGLVKQLTIFKNHPFAFPVETMERLEKLAGNYRINVIVNGHYLKERKYDNLRIHNIDSWEHVIGHSFIYNLTRLLSERRSPTGKMLFPVVEKDDFRRSISRALDNERIKSSIVKTSQLKDSDGLKLYDKVDDFVAQIEREVGSGYYVDALRSFGNGLPNLHNYESALCEIVLETRNEGDWHFTEKTFRPIAFGIPMVHLAHKSVHDKLLQYGYEIYDDGFYHYWHNNTVSLQDKLPRLIDFIDHIRTSKEAQTRLEQTAKHNYENFWFSRKLRSIESEQAIVNHLFGTHSLTNEIYRRLNF